MIDKIYYSNTVDIQELITTKFMLYTFITHYRFDRKYIDKLCHNGCNVNLFISLHMHACRTCRPNKSTTIEIIW